MKQKKQNNVVSAAEAAGCRDKERGAGFWGGGYVTALASADRGPSEPDRTQPEELAAT